MGKVAEYTRVAKRYRPAGVKIRFRRDQYLTPAHAAQWADGSREMYVPQPRDRHSLYVYLHECAHVHLKHIEPTSKIPLWKQEWEAEQWAIAAMRRENIPVPRAMIAEAKKYVRECAEIDAAKGREPPPAKIAIWMTRDFKHEPEPIENLRKPKRCKRKKRRSSR